MVKSIGFNSDGTIELIITHSEGPELKPAHIIAAIFKIDANNFGSIKVLKLKQITG